MTKNPVRYLIIFLTINLCLPDSISYSPKACQNEENISFLRVGTPGKQNYDHNDVEECAKEEDGDPASAVDDNAKAIGHDGITEAISDKYIANIAHAIGTADVALSKQSTDEIYKYKIKPAIGYIAFFRFMPTSVNSDMGYSGGPPELFCPV